MNRALAMRQAARAISLLAVMGLAGTGTAHAQQMIGACPVLPANNIWNTPVDALPVLSNSTSMVATIGANTGFHADFGAGMWDGGPVGIPFITVPGTQAKYPAAFTYDDESDVGPYAIPLNAPIEGGSNSTGDRHAMAVDTSNCLLYELYRAFPQSSSWTADSGAIYDLRSNALRPLTWTSADAAGLPIVPGLVTYEEVSSGEIKHAIRFTVPRSRREYVWPARHYASSLTGTQYPRMGERFRLKASFDVSTYPADVQVILRAMKKYGIMLADNGSAWFISGKPDARWNDDHLHTFGQLLGSNFEAVDATVLRIDPNSGAAIQSGVTVTVSPSSATVRTGRAQTLTATVTGAPNTVTWSVNGVAGGDAVAGTVNAAGQYIAPSAVPSPATVTVRAASTASTTSTGSASITILPLPGISSVSPSPLVTGPFTLTVNGVGFTAGSVVSFDGVALTPSVQTSTLLRVTGNAPTAKASVPVFVNTPDGERSNTFFVDVATPSPTIALSATSVVGGATVTATVANGPGTAGDWVGLFSTGAADGTPVDWKYLSGTRTRPVVGLTGATVAFAMPAAPGSYNVRFFLNDSTTKLATSATITVTAGTVPSIALSATTSLPGATVTATIANGPATAGDWVGLYAAGAPVGTYLDWKYLNGTRIRPASGVAGVTVAFTMPSIPGAYNVRFFLNDSTTTLATSATITVTAATAPSIALSATTSVPGGMVTATIANGPSTAGDWVGLYAVGAPVGTYLDWKYLNGTRTRPASGMAGAAVAFTMPATPGSYNVRFFLNDSTAPLATSATITVSAGTPSISLSATTSVPGGMVTVTIVNGPATAGDWVGLYAAGAPVGTYLDWKYLNGTRIRPASGTSGAAVAFTMPAAPGAYNVRFFLNDSTSLLATSVTIIVQ